MSLKICWAEDDRSHPPLLASKKKILPRVIRFVFPLPPKSLGGSVTVF